jgi:short-subunit dehydrogenase
VGAEFARAVAERGVNVVLLSRRQGVLDEVAAAISADTFDLVMTEALWSELHDEGVDVLSLVLGMTDTPALRRLLAERGHLSGPDDPKPIPGAMSPVDVVAEALDNLTNGPTWFAGELLREGSRVIGSMPRSDAVRMLIEHGGLMANLD